MSGKMRPFRKSVEQTDEPNGPEPQNRSHVGISLPQRERQEKYVEHGTISLWSVKKTLLQKRGTRKTKASLILYISHLLAPLMAGPINLTFGCLESSQEAHGFHMLSKVQNSNSGELLASTGVNHGRLLCRPNFSNLLLDFEKSPPCSCRLIPVLQESAGLTAHPE